jgi:hypothetical protein
MKALYKPYLLLEDMDVVNSASKMRDTLIKFESNRIRCHGICNTTTWKFMDSTRTMLNAIH